ncbi:hypothetical protein BC833DRAFT_612231 [Globomyces pollinis-pini]|nr:hypothetical protein BC833DRAFT_612231 [Globomyces pollinis-pini]
MEESIEYFTKNTLDFRYNKKPQRNNFNFSSTELKRHSDLPLKLIPIRIDLEHEGLRLKDVFTWNLNETLVTPEQFAYQLAIDMELMNVQFIQLIADSIREQVIAYAAAVEDDSIIMKDYDTIEDLDNTSQIGESKQNQSNNSNSAMTIEEAKEVRSNGHQIGQIPGEDPIASNGYQHQNGLRDYGDDKQEFMGYGDIRIVVKIDVHVGAVYVRDQFEWPLFDHQMTPEQFTETLVRELRIGGEFIPLIAHSIREQVVTARLNYGEAIEASDYVGPRDEEEWECTLRALNDTEIGLLAKEEDRNVRRMRRQRAQFSNLRVRYRPSNTEAATTLMTPSNSTQFQTPIPAHFFPNPFSMDTIVDTPVSSLKHPSSFIKQLEEVKDSNDLSVKFENFNTTQVSDSQSQPEINSIPELVKKQLEMIKQPYTGPTTPPLTSDSPLIRIFR